MPTGHSWKLPTWRPFLDQKQTKTISSYFLMLSRVEQELEGDAYWAQLEATNMETIFGPETDKDHQLLLPYAQQGGEGVGEVG